MCASEAEPDADLASAWLDDEEAGVLQNSNVPEISPAEASERARRKSSWLLDLRTARQFERSHATGAINIPAGEPGRLGLLFHFREDFEQDVLERFSEGRPSMLLICEVGVVSRVSADKLLRAGLDADITVVAGGFEAYCLETDLPLVTSPTADDDLAAETEDLYNEDFVQSMWSLWEEDEGELPMQPVLSMRTDEPPLDASAEVLGQEDEEGALADDLPPGAAGDAAADTPAGAGEGGMLNLAELEDLLGEAPATPPGAASVAPASASTAPSLGTPSGDYYSASPSRSARGIKQRRTRGGLPPAWLVDISHLDFPLLVSSGSLDTLSVKELKSWLYHHDGSLSGPKRDLVARVQELCPPAQSDEAPPSPPPPQQPQPGPPLVANGVPGPAAQAGYDEPLDEPLDGPKDDFLMDEVFSAM